MSSHHIVREKQEPALLILNLDNFSYELLGQLLEWSPTVIAVNDTIAKLNDNQIKVDWLIANNAAVSLQTNVKIIEPQKQDALAAAMVQLIAEGYPAVNVITGNFTEAAYLPFAHRLALVIYYSNKKIYPVKSGFAKWAPAGDIIEILSSASGVLYTGLAPAGQNKFETIADGFFSFEFKQPFIFIAEEIN